jgi:hypothetical protein
MARLNLLKSNGYKLLSWGHEATTYLCVGSLGFEDQANNNKVIMHASNLINNHSFKKF